MVARGVAGRAGAGSPPRKGNANQELQAETHKAVLQAELAREEHAHVAALAKLATTQRTADKAAAEAAAARYELEQMRLSTQSELGSTTASLHQALSQQQDLLARCTAAEDEALKARTRLSDVEIELKTEREETTRAHVRALEDARRENVRLRAALMRLRITVDEALLRADAEQPSSIGTGPSPHGGSTVSPSKTPQVRLTAAAGSDTASMDLGIHQAAADPANVLSGGAAAHGVGRVAAAADSWISGAANPPPDPIAAPFDVPQYAHRGETPMGDAGSAGVGKEVGPPVDAP